MEFRLFLLYLAPVILRNILPAKVYKHFLLLHSAIYILSTQVLCHSHLFLAQKLLKKFVKKCPLLYGQKLLVYNFHNLLHITDDVRKYGPLDSFSCFPFESFLGRLKKLVTSPYLPLEQIVKRVYECRERTLCKNDLPQSGSNARLAYPTVRTVVFQGKRCLVHSRLEIEGTVFDARKIQDRACLLMNGRVGIITGIISSIDGSSTLLIREFKHQTSLFMTPVDSSVLNVFKVWSLSSREKFHSVGQIKRKCVRLPYKSGAVVIPLCHQNVRE